MMQRSLMRHLLAWVLGALVLVWISFIVVGFRTGIHEADELTDGHLASLAALLLSQRNGVFTSDTDTSRVAMTGHPDLKSHDYQQSMSIVEWDAQGHVLTHTGEAPIPAFSSAEGFADLQLGSPPVGWRSFSRWAPEGQPPRKVMVLLSTDERDDLANDIGQQVAEPGLWLLPVIALALGWAIRRGLRPLDALSRDVRELDVHQATPLRTQHPHEEFKAVVDSINTLVKRQHEALLRERQLASELAHELRTPLASLSLHAGLLRSAAGEAERNEALARIEHDAQRAADVMAHLLALARASRTDMADAAQTLDLGEVAREVVAEFAQPALDSDHDLALADNGPLVLTGHKVLLQLALRNLIENTLSHTPRGTAIEVQLDGSGRWLQVCDDGAGRGEPQPAPAAGLGLGLGHRVVDKVAAIHGASFAMVAAPAPFTTCYRISFGAG
jgi:two-component system sensor histidine kinase QseC